MKIEPHHAHTYARLLERRARMSGRPTKIAVAVGKHVIVFQRSDRVEPFAAILRDSGDAFSVASLANPDPRPLGNMEAELRAAKANGELDQLGEDLKAASELAETAKDLGLN